MTEKFRVATHSSTRNAAAILCLLFVACLGTPAGAQEPRESVEDQIQRLVEERLADFSLASLIPSPVATFDDGSLGSYDLFIENPSWEEPVVTAEPIAGGYYATVTYSIFRADIRYQRTCTWTISNPTYCLGPGMIGGVLSIGRMEFAVELIDDGFELQIDAASVSTTLSDVEVDIDAAFAFLGEMIIAVFVYPFEEEFEEAMLDTFEWVIGEISSGPPEEIFSDGFESGDLTAWSDYFPVVCDAGLAIDDANPVSGAMAIDICQLSAGGSPGLVSAEYISIDGANQLSSLPNGMLGVGVVNDFGPNNAVRLGNRMLALSSGTARDPLDPGYVSPSGLDKLHTSAFPSGFPYPVAFCSGLLQGDVHDSAAIRLTLIPPPGASGFLFEVRFFTYDYGASVCTTYMDQFAVLMEPPPANHGPGNNIALGLSQQPVTVMDVLACTPGTHSGVYFTCWSGTDPLQGTGFDSNGATDWFPVFAPVTAGVEFELIIGIWDSGDGISDSTVLVDAFRWTRD